MKRILVVDDEENICSTIERFLIKLGYEVVTAYNWEDALDQFILKSYNLVILDVNMKGRDGLHVAEEMKEAKPEQKIILMTGLDRDEVYRRFSTSAPDFDDILYKPFPLDKLKKMIHDVINKK